MAMQANEIENMIREQFPNARITITDLAEMEIIILQRLLMKVSKI